MEFFSSMSNGLNDAPHNTTTPEWAGDCHSIPTTNELPSSADADQGTDIHEPSLEWKMSQLRGLQAGMHLVNELEATSDQNDDLDGEEFEPSLNCLGGCEPSEPEVASTKQQFKIFLRKLQSNSFFLWCEDCSAEKPIIPLWDHLRDHFIRFHTRGWGTEIFDTRIAPDFIHKAQSLINSLHTTDSYARIPPVSSHKQCRKQQPDLRYWKSAPRSSRHQYVDNQHTQERPKSEEHLSDIERDQQNQVSMSGSMDETPRSWPDAEMDFSTPLMIPDEKWPFCFPGGTDTPFPGFLSYDLPWNPDLQWDSLDHSRDKQNEAFETLLSILSSDATEQLETFSKTRQWKTLLQLRTEFNSRHLKFSNQASAGSESLKDFSRLCPKSEDLLNEGLLTYRDILQGHAPTTLQGVFAFVSLSFAMNGVMKKQGLQISFSPNETDFKLWRESIQCHEERKLYDEITYAMWLQPPTSSPPAEGQVHQDETAQLGETMENTVGWIMADMYTYDMDLTMLDPLNSVQANLPCAACFPMSDPFTSRDLNFQRSGRFFPLADTPKIVRGNKHQDLISGPGHPPSEYPSETSTISSLSGTSIFLLVVEFLKWIYEDGGTLLRSLCMGTSSKHRAQTAFKSRSTTEITAFYRFIESARVGILEPLLKSQWSWPMHLAASICCSLLQDGWLCSVKAIEESAVAIAKALSGLLGAETELGKFVLDLLHHSSKTFSHTDPALKCDSKRTRACHQNMQSEKDPYRPQSTSSSGSPDNSSHSAKSQTELPTMASPGLNGNASYASICHPSSKQLVQTLTPASPDIDTALSFRICDSPGCDKRYSGLDASTNLRRHKREKHGLAKSYQCPFPDCGASSQRRHNLKTHWRRRHKQVEMPRSLC